MHRRPPTTWNDSGVAFPEQHLSFAGSLPPDRRAAIPASRISRSPHKGKIPLTTSGTTSGAVSEQGQRDSLAWLERDRCTRERPSILVLWRAPSAFMMDDDPLRRAGEIEVAGKWTVVGIARTALKPTAA
jgi:hypothetical protein